jgi:hypothetical protein
MTKAGVPKGAQIVMINGDTAGPEALKFKQGAHASSMRPDTRSARNTTPSNGHRIRPRRR